MRTPAAIVIDRDTAGRRVTGTALGDQTVSGGFRANKAFEPVGGIAKGFVAGAAATAQAVIACGVQDVTFGVLNADIADHLIWPVF